MGRLVVKGNNVYEIDEKSLQKKKKKKEKEDKKEKQRKQ